MRRQAGLSEERIALIHRGEQERERALFYNILAGVVSVIPKLAAAILSGSVTLYASVMKTINEALGIVVAWLIARKIARGDGTYDYGMGKFENIARIITGGILLISVFILVGIAVMKFLMPAVLGTSGIAVGMAITLIMIVIDTGFWFRNYRIAQHEPSPLMDSQWRLFRLKAFANLVVFLALVFAVLCSAYPWAVYIDPVASLVIIGILFRSGYGMIRQSLPDLLDRTLEEELQLVVMRELAGHFDRYEQVHAIRSRRSGGSIYIEIFLEFPGDMRMSEVQEIMDRMKESLEEKIPKSSVNIIPTGCRL
ncbi:cation diffusion facilitator family transporter [Methanoregula sp.]|uniref:cation diffusion facilitator family transporter n=1 Tax=Methanoregula sp. TaxID=2052170 RepID=UPI000CC47EE2|nr:cation diffusion facilitator family transporter [Methanoregula sp.]PKG32760.1 MAG: cation transporter [Methanoregula sp.]